MPSKYLKQNSDAKKRKFAQNRPMVKIIKHKNKYIKHGDGTNSDAFTPKSI